jgi:2-methylisocitrate lyase-like PEP mutase family enzyme
MAESLAQALRSLHDGDRPLVLANVWDPGSARIVAGRGAAAIATSSAAVAEANGHADHEQMPAQVAFQAVAAIVAAVPGLPVTADMEAGYGLAPAEFGERLLATGAVGCNYEDSDHASPGQLRAADEQAGRIAALRAAAPHLVINARVDTFLLQADSVDEQLAEGVHRSRLYLDAGADCVYPIGLADEAVIDAFIQQVSGPVNILSRRGAPSIDRLAQLGVRRVSMGSGLYRTAMKAFTAALDELGA